MSNEEDKKKDIDKVSGVETTGHEWDGLKELNNPAPRWWILVWIVCTIWAVGYWFIYPTWPTLTGNTKGTAGWTSQRQLAEAQKDIQALKNKHLGKFMATSLEEIMEDKELRDFGVAGGRTAFKDNCAACHGTGASGSFGYPNLNDDDWLWGGSISEIYDTVKYGIRSNHDDTRITDMPAFLTDEMLEKEEIAQVTDYVLSLSGEGKATEAGATIFEEQCSSCHGEDGKGMVEMGSPDLTDAIWLFANNSDDPKILKKDVYETIARARNAEMPSWEGNLREDTIKQLSVYVHSLGGGE